MNSVHLPILVFQSPPGLSTPGALLPLAVLAAQVGALYGFGSYAMSRLAGYGQARGILGKLFFYLFILPGVSLHELAHYLGCKLTLTPVKRFVPFSPKRDNKTGRLTLGYVEHAPRGVLTQATIGLAPMVVNPVGIVLLTALFTPLEPLRVMALLLESTTSQGLGTEALGILRDLLSSVVGFGLHSPLGFAAWAYLCLSLSLGSCLSREDLSAVPAAAVLVICGVVAASLVLGWGPLSAAAPIASSLSAVYALPVAVAAVAAAVCAVAAR